MIMDKELELSDSQAVSTTAISANVIDLEAAGRDIGVGTPLYCIIQLDVATDFTTGDETYV